MIIIMMLLFLLVKLAARYKPIRFLFFFFLENQTTNLSVVLNKNTESCINITQYTTCQVPVFSPWDASLRTCEPQHR